IPLIRWLVVKHKDNYPLIIKMNTNSISKGGVRENIPPNFIKGINIALMLTILNRTSISRKISFEDIKISTKNKLNNLEVRIDTSNYGRNHIEFNVPYEIEPKKDRLLYLRIKISVLDPCTLNELKEDINHYLNEKVYLYSKYTISTNNRKYPLNRELTNFFEELLRYLNNP
ncbi:MAG: hypothetical protein P8Z50_06370, partial [candidate division WOR-3 bacterium]